MITAVKQDLVECFVDDIINISIMYMHYII